jgi:DNA repair protein RadC
MTYMFKLPTELMGKLVEIREKTGISLAQQVREAVKAYCYKEEGIPPKPTGYQIKTEIKLLTVKEAMQVKIRSSAIAYEIMRRETNIDRECAWVLHLNGRLELIEKELVSMGTVEGSLLHPREIFKKAIVNGASSIVVVHNHPSGDPTPSEEDLGISKRIKEAGELLGIAVNDFIIIGSRGYTSFVDEKIGGFK